MGATRDADRTRAVLRRVRQDVAERLGEAAAVETSRDRAALPLQGGALPRPQRRARQRRQLDLLRCRRRALATARRLEIGQAGSQAVELRVERSPVMTGCGIPAQRFADEGERGGRPAQLVLGARQALALAHNASVSL
jgi:hypothetical protein